MRLLTVFVAFSLTGAFAQDGPGPDFSYIRISPLLNALDANHDGVISGKEIDNAPAALRTLDKNHDGQLTADEVQASFGGRGPGGGRGEGRGGGEREATGPTAAELQETLMAFDKNKDGRLSRDEVPERMQGMFDRGDTNKDGFLTPDEIVKLAAIQAAPSDGGRGEGRGEGRGGGRGEGRGGPGRGIGGDPAFNALDTDRDGTISAEEINHASASLRTLDKNGDGQLTEEEVRPAFGRGPGGRGRGQQ